VNKPRLTISSLDVIIKLKTVQSRFAETRIAETRFAETPTLTLTPTPNP